MIVHILDSVHKEERFSQGSSGKKKLLSYKEKFHLVKKFLDLRAHKERNRSYQYKMSLVEEAKLKKEQTRLAMMKKQ